MIFVLEIDLSDIGLESLCESILGNLCSFIFSWKQKSSQNKHKTKEHPNT